ncbi:MAG: crossover junction endodeoxyribonuclease RuvC [Patescibacteria group bacterium]|jgi:Holliday junction resolvasome RuvABC endonuclease subunit
MKKAKDRIITLYEENKEQTVLGLDCSSATIGWGLISLSDPPKLISHGYIKPLDSKYSEIERLDDVYDRICMLCDTLKPSVVSVEDIFLFMKGKSKARTITLLTAFNRVISLAAYKKVGKVSFYTVHEIRKVIKNAFSIAVDIGKEDMPNFIRQHLEPNFTDIKNKKNEQAKETCDEADGIAAGWCYLLCKFNSEFLKLLEKKPTKKERKK